MNCVTITNWLFGLFDDNLQVVWSVFDNKLTGCVVSVTTTYRLCGRCGDNLQVLLSV